MRKQRRAPHRKIDLRERKERIVQLGTIIPDQVETMVTYTTEFTLQNAAGLYEARPFYTNAPYDVDPSLGSTATQGHSEMSALYNRCRVLAYEAEVQVCNIGVWPTTVVVLHRNTNASAAGGSAVSFDPYIGNPLAQHTLLTHVYGSAMHHVFKSKHTIAKVVGSSSPLTADSYQSLVNAIPTDTTYLEIGATIHNPAGTYLIDGVAVLVTLRMKTRYYERKQFTT
jgi:hypothetical protein